MRVTAIARKRSHVSLHDGLRKTNKRGPKRHPKQTNKTRTKKSQPLAQQKSNSHQSASELGPLLAEAPPCLPQQTRDPTARARAARGARHPAGLELSL